MVKKENSQANEINLINLINTLWTRRKLIVKIVVVFGVLGLAVAFTSRVEYKATCKLLPESESGSIGNLGSLAGLAGINLNSLPMKEERLSPRLYPEIINSLPFILEVLNDSIFFEQENIRATPFYYFRNIQRQSIWEIVKKYTIGLPFLIGGSSNETSYRQKESESYRMSKNDFMMIESFRERIKLDINDVTGIVEVSVLMPDPLAAAQIAKTIELMLTKAVIRHKTERARRNLEFVESAYQEARRNFENVQYKLANLKDRNKYVSSARAKIGLDSIEHEYDIYFSVYKDLASQVEQSRIQLKKETPVLTVLEPVLVPSFKHKPNRKMILLLFLVFGLMSSGFIILIQQIIKNWKESIRIKL